MRKSELNLIILILSIFLLSCGDRFYNDLEIINKSNDSLYYYVHPYKDSSYTYNIAYNVFDVGTNNVIKYKYVIDFSNNENAILPSDTVKPEVFQITWKGFAREYGGLSILFYKRKTLESLDHETPLSSKHIYKRIDLTERQLDSLNYIVKLE